MARRVGDDGGARRRADGPPRRAARHRARARAPRHIDEAVADRRAHRRRRGRRARAALAHLRPRRARRPRRCQGLPRPPRGARARAPPAALHALRARLARRVGARRRTAGRGRADPPRVAAGRRGAGAPDARGFFLTQLFAVRRDQGRLGELLDRARAARAPARRDRRHLAARRCRSCCCRPGSASAPAPPTRPRSPRRSTGLPGSLFRLSGLACVAEACAALGDARGAEALIAELEPHADRLVQTGVQRLLGLGPALPRPAARDRRPPGGGARQLAGRSRAPPRARRPAAGRGHPARSRRCIRRAPRCSIGRPATLPPLAGPTEAWKPAAGRGPATECGVPAARCG